MPDIDRTVILEALSIVTGAKVKLHTKRRGWHTALHDLTTDNFLSNVFETKLLSSEASAAAGPVRSLCSLLRKLSHSKSSALRRELFVDLENFFDPLFDFDFREGPDPSECSRGGEPYSRPWGWYRFALNVLDKYPDGNDWLGCHKWRSESSPGVYAMMKTFKSKTDGKQYKVVMQNRINPQRRVFTEEEDYWLIPVPEGTTAEQEKEIVEASIRPYGILIKEGVQYVYDLSVGCAVECRCCTAPELLYQSLCKAALLQHLGVTAQGLTPAQAAGFKVERSVGLGSG
ncbi:hypothetical protein NFI96_009463 [Prochilodus magdalenae]|nr:hypothetical protein NFI96_009463 [Prochilodus magdalenae]